MRGETSLHVFCPLPFFPLTTVCKAEMNSAFVAYYCFLCLCLENRRNPFHTMWLLIIINHPCSYENWHFRDWFTHCCPHPFMCVFQHISSNIKNKTNLHTLALFMSISVYRGDVWRSHGNRPSQAFFLIRWQTRGASPAALGTVGTDYSTRSDSLHLHYSLVARRTNSNMNLI